MQAVEQARLAVLDWLEEHFGDFQWRLPLVRRDELVAAMQVEPVVLLDHALTEKDLRHWDFVLVITQADLISYHRPFTVTALSRALDLAVISTSRIDPRAMNPDVSDAARVETMTGRLKSLILHALGHLAGVPSVDDAENYMHAPCAIDEIDRMDHFTEEQAKEFGSNLAGVADPRLEESSSLANRHPVLFYLQSCWINAGEISEGILEARPWEFPGRLSRLTLAALSTMLVLLMTAEAWDLGMSQSPAAMLGFSTFTIVLTTAYVLFRQRLFLRGKPLTEQTVTTNVATWAIVLLGMMTTYGCLFLTALALSSTLHGPSLVKNWAASVADPLSWRSYLTFTALVASLGLLVGALGASFEGQHYFRHVTYIDRET